MWAAIRYRRAQAAVLVLLSALIATCAVVAPLYQRALEQSLLKTNIAQASIGDTALTVRAGRGPVNPDFGSSALTGSVSPRVRALYGTPVGQLSDEISIQPRQGLKPSPGGVIARQGVCDHLKLTQGSCPAKAGEVLASAKDVKAWGWRVGQQFTTPITGSGTGGSAPQTATLRLVGAYEVVPDPGYWLLTQIDGKSGSLVDVGSEQVPAIDDFVTVEETFTRAWTQTQATLVMPLRRELVSLGNLDEIDQRLATAGSQGTSGGIDGAIVDTQLPSIIDAVRTGQGQLRVIVPLLMAQLGLLAGAILLLVAQAAVEQRRPEVALARLRGRSRDGAGRLIMGELALTVALGLPLGFGLAVLLTSLVRWLVLPDGVPLEVPWSAVVALAIAALVCLVAIWLAARPVQRLAVSALLRRVAPSRSGAFGVVDLLAVALAAFGVIGLATGSLDGPLALVTPTLLALAAGLVASRLAVPAAGASGRANLRRGRVGHALTAFGLQRRPTLRKVVTVVSVAVALTVFAANALVVGDRNWDSRAQLQTGAPLVIDTDSDNPTSLLATARGLDPSGRSVTPVGIVRRTDAESTPTIAMVTRDFDEVAFAPTGTAYRLGALAPPAVPSVLMKGTRVTGRLSWNFAVPQSQEGPPPGTVVEGGDVEADTGNELRLSVTTPSGQRLTRLIATLPVEGKGAADLNGLLLCPDGCRLDGLEFRKLQVVDQVSGTLTIDGFGIDGRSLDVSAANGWNAFEAPDTSRSDTFTVKPGEGDSMTFDLNTRGFNLTLSRADVPAVVPGILAGPIPPGGSATSFDAAGINGVPLRVASTQNVDALPVLGGKGVLVDYETLSRLGGRLPGGGTLSLWLADPADADEVTRALTAEGIGVLGRHTFTESKQVLSTSASAWGLRLAAFTGAMGILLAALVVIVMTVTGWRVVARDMAALHMSGVPLGVLRRSLVREQVVLVVVGSVVGIVCGTVSSLLAMPLVPLFDSGSSPVPALELAPDALAIAGVGLATSLALLVVGWLAAAGSGRRISLRRIRESL